MVQQWDYRVEPLTSHPQMMETQLKQLGWEAWELVDIIYPQALGTSSTAWAVPVAIFRRPVTLETPMTPYRQP